MKFVKQNLTLVICAAVVVLAIASVFYPFGFWKSDVQAKANDRYTSANGAITSLTSAKLPLPGIEKAYTGVPTPNLIKAKQVFNKSMADQAAEIVKNSAEANRGGRVEIETKDGKDQVTPLLEGKKEPNYLPVILHDQEHNADSMAFKEDYSKVFPKWMTTLVGSADAQAFPPRPEQLTAEFTDFNAKRTAALPPNTTIQAGSDQHEEMEFQRRKIMETAAAIHMYVDPGAFQVRPWLSSDSPPTEQMMFEALVDSWMQGDVVMAIATVNDGALKGKDAKDKNVGNSPIKRLMHITVGNDAQTSRVGTWGAPGAVVGGGGSTTGSLFFLPTTAAATGDTAAPAAAGSSLPNTVDVTRSMTGRASGSDYDVVLMQISMDIDPSYLNKFINELYRRNMGYTVLAVRTRTIDPLDRACNGFIYGETQATEVELVVEGLLFRNWTQPIMPDAIRASWAFRPILPSHEFAARASGAKRLTYLRTEMTS